MKKLFVFLIMVGLFLIVFSKQLTLLADIYLLGDPQVYEVKEGDWLSKLAKKHYDDVDLWRELALINMAPDPDYILPGEKILMPDAEAMNKLRDAKTISGVTGLVEDQRLALNESQSSEGEELAERTPTPAPEPKPEPEQPQVNTVPSEEDEATFPWVLFIAGLLIILGVVGLLAMIVSRRKKRSRISAERERTTTETSGGNGKHDESSRKRRERKSRQKKEEAAPFS